MGSTSILTSHGDYQNGALSRPCQSYLSGEIVFSGEAGHGGKPGKKNALEAAELFVAEATALREAEFADVALRHVLRVAGVMPSITPDEARVWLTVRTLSFERGKEFYDRLVALASGVASRSHVTQRHQPISGSRGYLANDVLARTLFERAWRRVGLPEWTPEEMAFMEELSRRGRARTRPMRLDRGLKLYDTGEDYYGQDDGEISWRIPLGRVNWAYPEEVTIHHWAWTAWSGHPASGKGALMATAALALGGLALLATPSLVAEAKAELARRTAGLRNHAAHRRRLEHAHQRARALLGCDLGGVTTLPTNTMPPGTASFPTASRAGCRGDYRSSRRYPARPRARRSAASRRPKAPHKPLPARGRDRDS